MKNIIIAVLLCISCNLNAQVALPTFQAAHFSESELYSFSSHTFTNCGATGRFGPTLTNCRSAYDTDWDATNAYFNMTNQGIQEWTVPKTGTYTFQLAGAYGGNTGSAGGTGSGRIVNGSMPLTKGDVIAILVGQKGGGSSGGGGTFVWFKTSETLILAAGGGGGSGGSGTPNGNATAPASQTANGFQGTTPSSYNSISAVTGGPGEYKDNKSNYWDATQTAGWGGDGVVQFGGSADNTPSQYYTEHGQADADNDNTFMIARSPLNGGQGAVHFYGYSSAYCGGFGGGASNGGNATSSSTVGGGGGGYQGGGNGSNAASGTYPRYHGGGGSSYISHSSLSSTSYGGTNTGHGYVTITQ